MRRRHNRRAMRVLRPALIALAVVLALLAGLTLALPWLAEPALRAALQLAGLQSVTFDRLRLGWGEIELEGAASAPDHRLDRLRVVYSLPRLLEGRLERIEIEGLRLRATLDDGRLQLTGFESSQDDAGVGVPLPQVEEMVVRDARVDVATPFGQLELPLSAEIRATDERIGFSAAIDEARLRGEGTAQARVQLQGDLPQDAPISLENLSATGTIAFGVDHLAIADLGEVEASGTIGIDLQHGRLHAQTSDLALDVQRAPPAPWQARLGEGRIELTAEGVPTDMAGTLEVALNDAGWSAADLTVSGASLHHQLEWSLSARTLELAASEAGALQFERLDGPGDLHAGPLRLRLEPDDRLLRLTFGNETPAGWRGALTAGVETLEAKIDTPAELAVQSQEGTVALALQGQGGDLIEGRITLADARLRIPAHDLLFEGIGGAFQMTGSGLVDNQAIPLTIRRISHDGERPWFAPLVFEGKLEPEPDHLGFEATVTRIGGGPTLTIRGEDASGSGHATVDVAPVTFGPNLQPGNLAPIMGGGFRDVSGVVALQGDLAWSAGRLDSNLAVLLDALSLSTGPARFEQINGVVRLSSLWPLTTPPEQQLAIGLLDLGLPLTDGVMTFALTPGPRLEVGRLAWRFAGGTVRAEPFSLGSALEDANVTLQAEQLALAQLFELTRLDGLTGEGSLDGVLPVRLSEGAAIIDGGELAATGPGVLRYRSDTAPAALQAGGDGVDLLLQALENFHYEALRLTLDGRTDAAMDIGLHLAGANPDLYDGYPIEFNLDLEGELGNILRQGVASYRIPDRIRERMQGFDR